MLRRRKQKRKQAVRSRKLMNERIKERMSEMLAQAVAGGARSQAAKELFTHGGCHAWAMAAATEWNGTMRLSLTLLYSDAGRKRAEADCAHAWCETATKVSDYLGPATTADELVSRFAVTFRHHPGFYAASANVGANQKLTADEIQAVLEGKNVLPAQFYGEREWLNRAVGLAMHTLKDFA